MPVNLNAPELAEWRNAWAQPNSGAGGRSFDQWLLDHIRESGDRRAASILAAQLEGQVLAPNDEPWAEVVAQALPEEFDLTGSTGGAPLEQGILDTALPGLMEQIEGDTARQEQVRQLTGETNAAFGQLRDVLGRSDMRFDGARYFQQNPDVAAEFERQRAANPALNADAFAEQHFQTYGRTEGRQPAYISDVLSAQLGNVDRTTQAIVDAAKGGAASTQAALAQMTAEQLANLTRSISTQRGAIEQLTAQQLGNLEQSISAQRQALATEVEQLKGNASAAAQARRAALEQQLAALNAAQAPVSQARLRAAEAEATGINLGLESTRDQIAAEAAREGFVGPSSFTDAALARAAIDARQGAARTMGSAEVANATDDRDIARFGANTRFSIEDVLAGDTQRAGDYGASGERALTAWGAETGRGIRDTGATSNAQLTSWGAETERGIGDAGATGRFTIESALADEIKGAQTNAAGQKSNYFDALYPSAVNAAQIRAGLPASQAQTLTSLIPYGTAGTNNALNTLNWWTTNVAPPTPTATLTQPSQTGNQVANLGANLVGSAFQIGNSQNWWQRPTPSPSGTTVPSSTTGRGGLSARTTPNAWTS